MKVFFESDCRKMINILNQHAIHFDGYNRILEINWWRQQFEDIKFTWISRDGSGCFGETITTFSQTICFPFLCTKFY